MSSPRPARREIHRISAVGAVGSADLQRRMRGYLISMAVRTACVVLAVICPPPARWVVLAGAIGLPYVAVLLANAGRRPASGAASGVPEHRADTADPPWPGTCTEPSVIPRSSPFDTLRTGEVQPPEATYPPRKGG